MLSSAERKEINRKFKERKPAVGVFAVRCTASGAAWVGASRNLDATKNQLWFALRLGVHRDPSLQQEWNARGAAAFRYEILEKLDEDVSALAVADLLKEKRRGWIEELGARAVLA
ncbi:GIY-YIG nuclease family protein [uncultured Paludibaculum sp.]|uniref:GIY-YIG nuclease family protein n=1 Tax=uncultured Paludibaculum sp. TaxID=1765020 RepID=UPI002AABAE52|nr:GIY-YIG nuclease family protein [uncultured Paludibaculum sp.]